MTSSIPSTPDNSEVDAMQSIRYGLFSMGMDMMARTTLRWSTELPVGFDDWFKEEWGRVSGWSLQNKSPPKPVGRPVTPSKPSSPAAPKKEKVHLGICKASKADGNNCTKAIDAKSRHLAYCHIHYASWDIKADLKQKAERAEQAERTDQKPTTSSSSETDEEEPDNDKNSNTTNTKLSSEDSEYNKVQEVAKDESAETAVPDVKPKRAKKPKKIAV